MVALRILIVVASLELLIVLYLALGWVGILFWLCEGALAALFTRAIGIASGNCTARAIIHHAETYQQDDGGLPQ